jgi:DNA-binding protein H-NS
VQYENLSEDELQQQLRQLEQSRADIERALEQRRQQLKYDLVQQIKDMILENGYEVAEIATLLTGRKRRAAAPAPAKRAVGRQYTRYVDPDNPDNVYVRGVIPGWMKQKMLDQGYDPSSKADRDQFKANSLHAVDD